MGWMQLVLWLQLLLYVTQAAAFLQSAATSGMCKLRNAGHDELAAAKKGNGDSVADLLGKATWAGAEVLGNVAAAFKSRDGTASVSSAAPQYGAVPASRAEAVKRLQAEYDNAYFISGQLDEALYAEDCEFADPFASFRGRARFKANLENLAGGFIAENDVQLLQPHALVTSDGAAAARDCSNVRAVTSHCMVRLQLALPWQPVLAWVWGVTHEFGPPNTAAATVFVRHIESWEVSAIDGVKQVFRSGSGRGLVPRRGAGDSAQQEQQ